MEQKTSSLDQVGRTHPWEKAPPSDHLLLLLWVSSHFLYCGPNIAAVNVAP